MAITKLQSHNKSVSFKNTIRYTNLKATIGAEKSNNNNDDNSKLDC